jgi:hypothetical protein
MVFEDAKGPVVHENVLISLVNLMQPLVSFTVKLELKVSYAHTSPNTKIEISQINYTKQA